MHKLYLSGFVGQVLDLWTDEVPSTTYNGMKKNLEGHENDGIELHINSKGGDAFEGMAMLGLLKGVTGEKVAIVEGICASAATLPLFAMDKVKAQETSMFLFHKSATMAYGHSEDLKKSAEELDTIDETITELYAKKFKGTNEELVALLSSDKLISAKQALEFGLIDEIIPDLAEEDPEDKEKDLEKDKEKDSKTVEDVAKEAAELAYENNKQITMLANLFKGLAKK